MINVELLQYYINTEFGGNVTKAANAFKISASGLSRLLSGKRSGSLKTAMALNNYCKAKKLQLSFLFF